jgi:hypothetical protein
MRTVTLSLLAIALLAACVLAVDEPQAAEAKVGGPVSPDGEPIQCLLPTEQHMRNTGGIGPRGPGSGAGLCVFTSLEMAARYQNEPRLEGLQKYMTTRQGGGWPEKVVQVLREFARSRGQDVPRYLQVEGRDLEILRLALRTGRPASVTTGYLPGYAGRIAHMTNLMHASGKWFAILDNNYPGRWAWLTEAEFSRSYNSHGQGWAVILLHPAPPPSPKEEV